MLAFAVGAGHGYSGRGSRGGGEPCELEAILQAADLVVPGLHTSLPSHCLPLLARCAWLQVTACMPCLQLTEAAGGALVPCMSLLSQLPHHVS